jgi:cytochrome c-type biogenesis protein CcmH/NrfG
MAATDRDALERELEFLVRSIQDLETERRADDIDDETYGRLRREYVERETEVRRALAGEPVFVAADPGDAPARPPSAWRGRLLLVGAIGTFAAAAAIVLTLALSDRLPGQTASGNSEPVATDDRQARLEAAVEARPDDPIAHLALARFLLGAQDFPGALRAYDDATRLDPTNPEPPAYAGWVLFLAASSAPDVEAATELIGESTARLDQAILVDPDYPDARAFRGIVRLRGIGDPAGAVPDLQRFLASAPDHPLAPQVRELLAEALDLSAEQPPDQEGSP